MANDFTPPEPDDMTFTLLRYVLAARQALAALDAALVDLPDPQRVLGVMAGLGAPGSDTELAVVRHEKGPVRDAAPEVVDVDSAHLYIKSLRERLADASTLVEQIEGRPTDRDR